MGKVFIFILIIIAVGIFMVEPETRVRAEITLENGQVDTIQMLKKNYDKGEYPISYDKGFFRVTKKRVLEVYEF